MAIATFAMSGAASADDAYRAAWSTPFVLGLRVEPFPLPFQGLDVLTFEAAPSRWASIEVGGGIHFGGPAAFAMAHVQAPVRSRAVGIEAGFVTGSFELGATCGINSFGAAGCNDEGGGGVLGIGAHGAVFGRIGGTFQHRSLDGHFVLRASAGASALLDRDAGYRYEIDTGRSTGAFHIDRSTLPVLFYAGVSMGYGFRL